jgi:hypothetical protein
MMRWMTWRTMYLAGIARHVIGLLAQYMGLQNALDEVAGNGLGR